MTKPNSSVSAWGRSLLALAPMFLAMGICWVADRRGDSAEFYPLSSFPMYSKFDARTYVAYLKSADGQPLPTVPTVSMVSSQLKKRYGDALDDLKKDYKGSHFDWTVEQKKAAGLATLVYLRDTHAPGAFANGKLKGVKLVDVRIYLKDGKLIREEQEIAQLD
ncbi:MAG: hypothetical protein KDM64_09690 [Verrucomicrobiae bacterium]|nr:hypothetical protein [Verrucomicrobiae bacterium]